jgi:hypothetical protein
MLLLTYGLYCSITRLMCAIGRLICARQEECIIASSVQELRFNILQDVRFKAVRVACDMACQRSVGKGKCTSLSL